VSSSGASNDAGTGADANATADAGASFDATASIDAGSTDGSAREGTQPDAGAPSSCEGGAAPSAPDGGCVAIDVASYDRSCASDSDCTAISVGMVCNGGCQGACPNAAINVRDRACYEQTIPQPPGGAMFCECGNLAAPDARCINGVCTFCQPPWNCHYSEWTQATVGGPDGGS
jgi:hypothetical protein